MAAVQLQVRMATSAVTAHRRINKWTVTSLCAVMVMASCCSLALFAPLYCSSPHQRFHCEVPRSILGECSNTNCNDNFPDVALLSEETVNSVEKFVLFASYSRSGSSITGSIIDAHPNVIIAHEFYLFTKLKDNPEGFSSKWRLFNELYLNSHWSSIDGLRTKTADSKGYTLEVEGLFQGRFNGSLRIIGDKTGADTANFFDSHPWMSAVPYYKQLTKIGGIPLYIIHVLRNPYDLIATSTMYKGKTKRDSSTSKLDDPVKLKLQTRTVFRRAAAIQRIKDLNTPVIDVHLVDLVSTPVETMQRLCDFLELTCSEDYLQKCKRKVFGTMSKTRNHVRWPQGLREQVEKDMKPFTFFSMYSFTSD